MLATVLPTEITQQPDIDAYFARIGYTGTRTPTLETLNGIVMAHACAIPFENLDVLLGKGIDLGPAAVERKLVQAQRGGYCFEQNGLLLRILVALGFEVRPLSARVRWQRPREFTPPRTHLFLRVEIDGRSWLADVGVGGLSPTCAIPLDESGNELKTPHEPRRLIRSGGRLFHQVRLGDDWHDVYEFTLEEMPEIDREVANWFTSCHPQSHFRSRLMVARATPSGRLTLMNGEFTERETNGQARTSKLSDPEELLGVLRDRFGLEFPSGTRFGPTGSPWPS